MPQTRPRVVVDTNLLLSAALRPDSTPRQTLDYLLRHAILLSSPQTVEEAKDVFLRADFDRYGPRTDRVQFLNLILDAMLPTAITEEIAACRHPKDDKFLSLAVSGKASFIVTGDNDLLVLNPFRGINILTPRQYLDQTQPTPLTPR